MPTMSWSCDVCFNHHPTCDLAAKCERSHVTVTSCIDCGKLCTLTEPLPPLTAWACGCLNNNKEGTGT